MLRRSTTLGKVGTRREGDMLGAVPVRENEEGDQKRQSDQDAMNT